MGASAGRVLLISKGDWNSSTTYTGLDWVRHNGAAWVCKNTCTNIEPTFENTNYWQLISKDGDIVTADTAMSSTSTNAVQNKVIKSYVDNSITGISDMTGATATQNGTHGFVPAPQAGDEKKVLLGDGTWGAIDDKFSFADHDTAKSGTSFTDAEDGNMIVTDWTKNLLNPTLETTTQNGVTCTNNGDGTYTLNGTASSIAFFNINMEIPLEVGKTYKLVCLEQFNDNYFAVIRYIDKVDEIATINGVFTAPIDKVLLYVVVYGGRTVNNAIIKPMLTTDLSATYDDFVPYSGYDIKTCGKNLLNPTLETTTNNGITCTNNGDGTYTLNGTASNWTSFYLPKIYFENGKKYKMIGCVGGSGDTYYLSYGKSPWYICVDENGVIIEGTGEEVQILITCKPNSVLNNIVFKPMITTDLSATYDDFEPYTGETITVTNDTEYPAFGLKSHKGITNIISPGNVKCVYPTNESGKGVLDAMYNNELSKLKNAIFTYSTKSEYDTAVANNEIPDGATVIKDYDD